MMTDLTFKDYQLISAYLDCSCSQKEKNLIEERIKKDAQFNQAYLEFKHTKRLMQSMPLAKVPRNFTLSRAQAPKAPQRFFLAPALNYTSAVAAVLVVVLFAGTRLLPYLATPKAMEAAAPVTMAAESDNAAVEPTTAPLIIWGGALGIGGGGGGAEGIGGSAGMTTYATEEPGAMLSNAPSPETLAATPSTSAITREMDNNSNLILGVADEADRGKEIPSGSVQEESTHPLSGWQIAEIVLGVVAAVSAIFAWLIKKRS